MSQKDTFLAFLQDYHDAVFACEARALDAIRGGDQETYNACMKEKAERMSRISDACAEKLAAIDEPWTGRCAAALRRFSASASMGLRIGSPFFWSALLWDEDADPSEPDNLQKLIDELKAG